MGISGSPVQGLAVPILICLFYLATDFLEALLVLFQYEFCLLQILQVLADLLIDSSDYLVL